MRVAITGSSGLVGSALADRLRDRGDWVDGLRRMPLASHREGPVFDRQYLGSADAVVHLAGENVAEGRWNQAKKKAIYESRVLGSRNLVNSLAELPAIQRPKILLAASAIGYYGAHPVGRVDEQCQPGSDFLARTCQEWEAEVQKAELLNIRVVLIRIGMVLSRKGGALAKMIPVHRAGLAGPLGSGNQRIAWISLKDLVSLFVWSLDHSEISGVINGVAPEVVRQKQFSQNLASRFRKRAFLPVPAMILKLLFGEMAEALLLSDCPVESSRLSELGFIMEHPDLRHAFDWALSAEASIH